MSRNFAVAIGISAMDGILCAFVAVLALAFILQAPDGEPRKAGDSKVGLLLLEVEKRPNVPMSSSNNTAVSARIRGLRGVCKDVILADFDNSRPAGIGSSECAASARWMDCRAVTGSCAGYLLFNGLVPDQTWSVQLISSDRIDSLEFFPDRIGLLPTVFTESGLRGERAGEKILRAGAPEGASIVVEVTQSGRIKVR